MKTLQLLSVSALALAGLSLLAVGCGASTVDESPAADAAVADAAREDAAVPDAGRVDASSPDAGRDAAAPVDASCVPGPSILDAGVPDAAISADGGNTGACATCIQSACPAEVAACDAECECNLAANDLFACLNSGQSAFACAQQIGVGSSPALQGLGQCALGATQCRTPCGINFP
jgi:hypothetical protein